MYNRGSLTRFVPRNQLSGFVNSNLDIGECECFEIKVCKKECNGNGNGGQGCTFTQGYWKTHGPAGCNPSGKPSVWPVNNLTLGTINYSEADLCQILNTPVMGNGLISLAHQLIAAKLNVANGASDAPIAATIIAADALINGLVIPPIGAGFLMTSATSALTSVLDSYNNGLLGIPHCD